jgi:hypothetical protein
MAHLVLSFASFSEENSRTRLPARIFIIRPGKRPALANVRALNFVCKEIFRSTIVFFFYVVKTTGGRMVNSSIHLSCVNSFQGNKPRTSVASATRLTATVIAAARGGT